MLDGMWEEDEEPVCDVCHRFGWPVERANITFRGMNRTLQLCEEHSEPVAELMEVKDPQRRKALPVYSIADLTPSPLLVEQLRRAS